jgi:hypothetical protein
MYFRTIESDQAEMAYRQERIGRSFRRSRRADVPAGPAPVAQSNEPDDKPTRRNVRLAA